MLDEPTGIMACTAVLAFHTRFMVDLLKSAWFASMSWKDGRMGLIGEHDGPFERDP